MTQATQTVRRGAFACFAIVVSMCIAVAAVSMTGCSEERTEFGGISFVLPEGWTAEVDGTDLTLTPPEGEDTLFNLMTGEATPLDASGYTTEQKTSALNNFIDGFIGGVAESSYSSGVGSPNVESKTIDGAPSAYAHFTMKMSGFDVSTHVFAIVLDDSLTKLTLGSTSTAYDADIEKIINSIRVAK